MFPEDLSKILNEIEQSLKFYADMRNFGWGNCKCGGFELFDRGEEAEDALEKLRYLKEKLGIKEDL